MNVTIKDGSGNPQTVGALPAVGQAASAASVPVVLASDQSAVPVSPALSAANGWTPKLLNGLSTTPVQVKASAGQLGMIEGYNPNASQVYLQLFDSATTPTLGTTVPVLSIPIAPTSTGGFAVSTIGVQFANGLYVAATTTATGSTAPTTAPDCNALYH